MSPTPVVPGESEADRTEELRVVRAELRELQLAVAAMREALEQAQRQRDEAVQAVMSQAQNEQIQLREAVSAMRDALENQRIQAEQRQQAALRDLSDENRQLRATIAALRDQWAASAAPPG
jgi:PIN domain nuclease of toxin-antitoxin system